MNILEDETKLLRLKLRLAQLEKVDDCQNNFLNFVNAMWPDFILGTHHEIIAKITIRECAGGPYPEISQYRPTERQPLSGRNR